MRALRSLVVVGLLVAGGCGDRSTIDGVDAAGDEQQVTETTVVVADTTTAQDVVISEVGGLEAPADLGGVTIDDPMPDQTDAITDAAAAETAVRFAYQHWILVDLDPDLRARLIENGAASKDGLADGFEAARSIVYLARIQVDSVTFPAPDRAQVAFRIEWNGGPSPYFPKPQVGVAVFQDGSWRVGRRTLCLLALGSGQDCAGTAANPVSPESFAVVPPDGFVWAGFTEPEGYVGVDQEPGIWIGDSQLSVTVRSLVGLSAIDPADVDAFLGSGNLGLPDGTPASVGAYPARIEAVDDQVRLVVLRDDDVLLRVELVGRSATTERALAVAAGVQPSGTVVTVEQGAGDDTGGTVVPVPGD